MASEYPDKRNLPFIWFDVHNNTPFSAKITSFALSYLLLILRKYRDWSINDKDASGFYAKK